MQFTITWIHLVLLAVGLIAGLLLRRLIKGKQPKDSSHAWNVIDQLFNSISDLVALIGLLVGGVMIFVMIIAFQDELKSEAGYILMAALNGFFYLAGVREGKNSNGKS